MKKTLLLLSLCLCLALSVPVFAASEEESSSITVSVTELKPGYYLCAVWNGDTLLRLFDYTVGSDGKLETTVEIGEKLETGTPVTVGISNANTEAAEAEPIPPIVCTVENATPSKPSTPGDSGKPSHSSSGGGGGSRVSVSSASHGKITASPSTAHKGDKVTLNVRPDSGYELKEVIVRDSDGKQISVEQVNGTRYTFVMPSGKVTVEPVFEKIGQTPAPAASGFYDVPANAYYYEAVQWAIEKGITNGTTDSTFSPNATCTRAQMVTFLWRAAGSPAPNGRGQSFADISAGAYYYDAVLWAVEQGITNGATATTFDPEGTVTRAQTVTFLYRAAGSPKADSRASFSDVASGAYYADAIGWAAEQAITNGTTATTFSPANGCTRAQIVTFLYRANT